MKHSSCLPGIFVWRRQPFTYKGSAVSLPSLALDSAVGSRVNSSVAHPETARQWYHILYSPHIRNKHHQRASDGVSTSSKLGQLLAHPGDVLPLSLEVAKMLAWVCARAGFYSTECETHFLFYLATHKLT